MVAACWSPAMPRYGNRAAEQALVAVAESGGGILHLGQHRARHAQQLQEIVVPLAGVDVEQQRARGVGGVGRVHACRRSAATADSNRRCRTSVRRASARSRAPGTWSRIQATFVAGEIGIDDQAGLRRNRAAHGRRAFSLAQISAVRRSCQTMARCTALPVARSHTTVVSRWLVIPIAAMSFALSARLFQRLAADLDRRGPDVLRLVLDPARGRKMLREFLLRRGGDGNVAAEHDGARGRGALIDGQHKGHGVASRKDCGCARGNPIGRRRSISGGSRCAPSPLAGEGRRDERIHRLSW